VQTVRPPSEESLFAVSYVALRGLKTFGTTEQRPRVEARFRQVRDWALTTPAKSTEDRAFRLRLLHVAGAPDVELRRATQELLQTQRSDGGWAQLDSTESDAYATGTALTALHQAGGVATSDAAYQRGLTWLLKAQQADGSWHVATRSTPIQTYYESGYPHGEDQFISITAAGWATTALALALPKAAQAETKPTTKPAPKSKPAADTAFKYGSPDEPLREKLSLAKAAESLDRTSLTWVRQRKCGACHTTYPYLMSRMALGGEPSPAFAEVRKFFDDRTADWDANSKTNKHITRETVANAASLAVLDAQTTGTLQPLTRVALDKMWTLQRKDGAWNWPKCSWPPFEVDDYYGALLAALGVGHAPDGYAQSESARAGLAKLRAYFDKTPPPSLHHKAWLLWAALKLDGLMSAEQRKATIAELLALQRADGGWCMESLGKDWVGREGERANPDAPSDGYGTGLVVFVLRQAGVSASHDALQRGVKWLSANQRESGRWFTRSMNGVEEHFISDTATAFAVLALKACE
jgi:squalene-hopene/tetraprenyl-beta-curcumene cyclase